MMDRVKLAFAKFINRTALSFTLGATLVFTQGCEKVGFQVIKQKFTQMNEAPVVVLPSPVASPVVRPIPLPSPSPLPPAPSPLPSPKPSPTPVPVITPKPSPSPLPSPSPKPSPSPTPTVVPSPTPVACKAGPEIRVVAGVTSTSLTATFHGEEIHGIDYRILSKTGVEKASGHITPVHNHPDISYGTIEPGEYQLVFKATGCVGGSAMDFKFDPSLVCDPFGQGSTNASRKTGIEAKLTYLSTDTPPVGLKVEHFFPGAPNVTVSTSRIILSQLNIPSRPFSEGFVDGNSGKKLLNEAGEPLVEFFSLQAEASLRLSTSEAEGEYEIAIISDDGSTMDLDTSGEGKSFTRWIDNDGGHSNQMGCAVQSVKMNRISELPMKLNYYQGTREQIALMVLWRLKNASSVEPECGGIRHDFYYFSGGEPTSNYSALQARGWKVLTNENYVLPNSISNPCQK